MKLVAATENTRRPSARQENEPSPFRSIGDLARKVVREAQVYRRTVEAAPASRNFAA